MSGTNRLRNQAFSQLCAFSSPLSGSKRAIEMLRQPPKVKLLVTHFRRAFADRWKPINRQLVVRYDSDEFARRRNRGKRFPGSHLIAKLRRHSKHEFRVTVSFTRTTSRMESSVPDIPKVVIVRRLSNTRWNIANTAILRKPGL